MERRALKLIANCRKCKGKKFFHIGDKITFGGNKTYFSHSELRSVAEYAGLFLTGKQKHVRAVILNPNGASKKNYIEAKKFADRVMSPNEFKSHALKICRGKLPKARKKAPFKNHLKPGARIFCLVPENQMSFISGYIFPYGARISNRKTKNLQAVIASKKFLSPGHSDLFKFLGVPVYYLESLKLHN